MVSIMILLLANDADFEVVYTFELMTQPSENCSGAENR